MKHGRVTGEGTSCTSGGEKERGLPHGWKGGWGCTNRLERYWANDAPSVMRSDGGWVQSITNAGTGNGGASDVRTSSYHFLRDIITAVGIRAFIELVSAKRLRTIICASCCLC